MDIAHIYIAVQRMTLGDDNWVLLIDDVMALKGVGDAAHERLQQRGNLDMFEYVPDDPETEADETVNYSNVYIFEANFPAGAVDFDKFQTRLVTMFEVDPEDVTYSVGTTTIRDRLSCFATYKYNNIGRVRIGLFGCASDSEICTWAESRVEAEGYIDNNKETMETVQ